MNTSRWFLFVCLMLAMVIPVKHALFIFQQNRYETGRLNAWIKDSVSICIKNNILNLLLAVFGVIDGLTFHDPERVIVMGCLLLVMAAIDFIRERHKTYIKPLVYTARVKRQIAVMTVLAVLWNLVLVLYDLYPVFVFSSLLMPWILLYPMSGITAPVEAAVKQSFLNDAKKILASDPDLIKIGITGSFGKTTTKNIMQAVLSEQFNSLMTPASYNTPMGITRTIREMLKPIHQVFICEMGADHVGDISELMDFVQPSIGVVTSIGPQHLNTFGSQENITREKMKIIEMLPKDGFGIMNYDNDFIRNWKVRNPVQTVTYGIHHHDVDYYADDIQYTANGSVFTIVHENERIPFETKLLGELNILNILSAVAAARYLNVSWAKIQRAVKQMKQVEHRLELKKINGYRFIDDAFNANPVGSAMALEVLSRMPGKRFIVTPGMIDLGEKQDEINHHFGTLMKDKADTVVLVGEIQTKPIYEGLKESGFDMDQVVVLKSEKEAFNFIWADASRNDTILLENDLPDAFNH